MIVSISGSDTTWQVTRLTLIANFMQLSSVSSQMKVRERPEHEQVAEAAHSHGGTAEGKVMGRAGAFNLEVSLSTPQGSVLPAERTFLP